MTPEGSLLGPHDPVTCFSTLSQMNLVQTTISYYILCVRAHKCVYTHREPQIIFLDLRCVPSFRCSISVIPSKHLRVKLPPFKIFLSLAFKSTEITLNSGCTCLSVCLSLTRSRSRARAHTHTHTHTQELDIKFHKNKIYFKTSLQPVSSDNYMNQTNPNLRWCIKL
jgi:hypothetical protein